MARLSENAPVRRLRMSSRALTGKVTLAEGSATFESSLEHDWLELLDFDRQVLELQVQPFSIYHEVDGARRRYTPDVLVLYSRPWGPETVVYEVKSASELREKWGEFLPRFRAATRHCRSQGWRFKVVNEKHIRTPLLTNARFLRRYRQVSAEPIVAEQLRYTFKALGPTTPQALLAAAYWSQEPRMLALPVLWQMIGRGDVGTDLTTRLTMKSKIWLPK